MGAFATERPCLIAGWRRGLRGEIAGSARLGAATTGAALRARAAPAAAMPVAARRGVNHQAVCLSVSGRTAATISSPGITTKLSSRGAPSAASRDRRYSTAQDGSPASASSGGGGAFVILGAGHAAIDGIAVHHRAIGAGDRPGDIGAGRRLRRRAWRLRSCRRLARPHRIKKQGRHRADAAQQGIAGPAGRVGLGTAPGRPPPRPARQSPAPPSARRRPEGRRSMRKVCGKPASTALYKIWLTNGF